MCHVWGRGEVHTGFQWADLKGRNRLEKEGVNEEIILDWISKKALGKSWTELTWLRTGTIFGLL